MRADSGMGYRLFWSTYFAIWHCAGANDYRSWWEPDKVYDCPVVDVNQYVARETPEGRKNGWNEIESWKKWNGVQKSSVRYKYAATVHGRTRVLGEELGCIGEWVRVSECVNGGCDDT